jgi:hypothetical protein
MKKPLAQAQNEPDTDPYTAATLLFGIHYERAVQACFDELPGIIGKQKKKGRASRTL